MENLNPLMDALPAPLPHSTNAPYTSTQRGPRNYVRRGPLSRPTTLQHRRNQQRRHENMRNVNTIVPRAASVEFRQQQCRRELWMAKAQAKQTTPRVNHHMKRVVAQQKRKLQYLSRQQKREIIAKHPNGMSRLDLVTSIHA